MTNTFRIEHEIALFRFVSICPEDFENNDAIHVIFKNYKMTIITKNKKQTPLLRNNNTGYNDCRGGSLL